MKTFISKLAASLCILALALPGVAQELNPGFTPTYIVQQMDKGQAAAKAKRQHGGKVLSVQQKGDGNFKVKLLLDSGHVKIVTIYSNGSS